MHVSWKTYSDSLLLKGRLPENEKDEEKKIKAKG